MTASGFSVYDASAGSGKTFTLVKAYLQIILSHPSDDAFKSVLAITFTNKAAKEMKTRIVKALVSFAEDNLENPSQLLVEVAETLKKSPLSVKDKANGVLRSLLQNYTAFEVSTIDTFTVKIIRTFANDLRLAQAFEIELDTDRLYQLAIDELLRNIGKDVLLTDFIIDFVLKEIENDKNWDVSKQLLDVMKKLENENDQAHFVKLTEKKLPDFLKLIRQVSDKIKSSKTELKSKALEALNLIEECGLVHDDFLSGYLPNHFQNIILDYSKINFEAKWKQEIDTVSFYKKTQKAHIQSIIDDIRSQLVSYFKETKQLILSLRLYDNILKNIRPMAILNKVSQHYKELKAELQLVTLPEANSLIWEQVRNQPVPFIYERMGQRYRHFFIDEFQDTSQRQWQNLIPLLDHTLSNFDAQGQNGSVLLVGDAKQSIYRWRGGYPEQFIDLGNGKSPFPHCIPEKKLLDTNYRSLFEIANFNNHFFTHIASFLENEAYKNLYLNGNHQKINKSNGGFVSIDFLTATNDAERDEIYPPCILNRVREIITQGFQASDICILVRKRKNGTLIANHLIENGIQVISEENLLLSSNPETAFLVDWLKLVHQPGNKEVLLNLLEFWAFHRLKPNEDKHAFIAFHIDFTVSKLLQKLANSPDEYIFDNLKSLSLYDGAEQLVSYFNLCDSPNAYIRFLLDEIHLFSVRNGPGLSEFLDWWEIKKEVLSLSASEAGKGIRIMTIHKSKGLEFPVVIYPYADLNYTENREKEWIELPQEEWLDFETTRINFSKSFASDYPEFSALFAERINQATLDNFNICYVAQTRAVEQLYLLTDAKNNTNKTSNTFSDLYISYLKHIGVWQENQARYVFGKAEKVKSDKAQNEVCQDLWVYRNTRTQLVTIATKASRLWGSPQHEAIEKGNLLHLMLAEIHFSEDVITAVEKAIMEGWLDPKLKDEVSAKLFKVVNHPSLKSYFEIPLKVLNEQTLISANGVLLRPDRIVIKPGSKAILIDYKTGQKKPEYQAQIEKYAQTLTEMGFTVEKSLLVYLDEEIEVV